MNIEPEEMNLATVSKICADEDKARELLESILWPNGAVCPHCQSQKFYKLTPKADSKRPARKGVYKCATCRKQYTVTVGTIFADSHIPISKWMMAIFLLCSAKKAISAHQLHRSLGLAYRSAWFMAHRIRHAMNAGPYSDILTGIVEADETYVGGRISGQGRGPKGKVPVLSMVERGGRKRSVVLEKVTGANLKKTIMENVASSSTLVTDEYRAYRNLKHVYDHRDVKHSAKEYARKEKDMVVHTNTVEGSFSLLKRGIIGAFHHVSKKHLPRYMHEFDFRWNHRKTTDGERMVAGIKQVTGKRLTYRPLTSEGGTAAGSTIG